MRGETKTEDKWPGEENDAILQAIVSDLEAEFKCLVPAHRLDRQIAVSIRERQSRSVCADGDRHGPRRFRSRLSSAIAGALVAGTLVAAGYRILSPVETALNLSPTTRQIVSRKLGEPLHLSQTIRGFTVSIERAYVSPGMVVIGYTIRGPAGHTFRSFEPFGASNGTQAQIPALRVSRRQLSGTQNSWTTGVENGVEGGVLVYHGLAGYSGKLHLQLDVPAISADEQTGSGPRSVRFLTIPGPFVFDFHLASER